MKRILVVDGEPALVRGLEGIGDQLPDSWELAFVPNAATALEEIDRETTGIVVSKARSGDVNLLAEVKRRQPHLLRVVIEDLSPAGRSSPLTGEAQERLPFHGSRGALRAGLVRSCALHDAIQGPGVKRLVDGIGALPALPSLYMEFLEATRDPTRSIEDLGAIIARDIALTGKVIQIVNSALYGLPQKVVDPGHAATFLGLDMLRSLVLSVKAFDAFATTKLVQATLDSIWQHSMRTGMYARAILEVERCDRNMVESGFLAGMMHDCGKLVLAAHRPDRYDAVLRFAVRDGRRTTDLEEKLFGVSHPAVGGHLLAHWGMPATVVEAVAFHHEPSLLPESDFSPLCAVHVANRLSQVDLTHFDTATIATIDHTYLNRIGRLARLPRWIDVCRETIESVQST